MIYLDLYGNRYEDDEPCFFPTSSGGWLWNRIQREWQTWASVNALAIAMGHVWQPREIGLPSIKWQRANSFNYGQFWGPGLDDTSGLASETVTNGDAWTGALLEVPPTGWTAGGTGTDFTINDTNIIITAPADEDGSMSQTLTLVAGEWYVLEIAVGVATTPGCQVSMNGIGIGTGVGPEDPASAISSVTRAVSFQAPSTGSGDLEFLVPEGGALELKFVRCYQEAELTGSGGAVATGPTPTPTLPGPVTGPYMADGVDFWIDTSTGKTGFNLDTDEPADIWFIPKAVCKSDLSDQTKLAISAQREALGLTKLPCVNDAGEIEE